jgi:hypothetical protein
MIGGVIYVCGAKSGRKASDFAKRWAVRKDANDT